ncbi:MAG TPA: LysR family transcriptional regulator [Steroidobacteraceae bacterium]|jgi:DNA-binding transcriptional LysR family regulator|nr:LysR family transcriptional regulator [Steroidobacteraceae bacterium]
MDLNNLKRFVAAADGGSLGKAAAALNISQPGLSKSIHQLELDFGGKLLDRSARGVTLTAFGRTVYVRAKRILAEWRHLDNERVALFNGLVGHITVGVARGTGFLGRVIPAVSARLSSERYAVQLTVTSGVANELTQALRLGDLDFAVAVLDGVKTDPDLVQEVLFYDRCGLFADARHPLAARATSGIRELAAYCWLCSSDADPLREALAALAHSNGVLPRKTLIDSNSVVYLISTLIGSDFIGLLPMARSRTRSMTGASSSWFWIRNSARKSPQRRLSDPLASCAAVIRRCRPSRRHSRMRSAATVSGSAIRSCQRAEVAALRPSVTRCFDTHYLGVCDRRGPFV